MEAVASERKAQPTEDHGDGPSWRAPFRFFDAHNGSFNAIAALAVAIFTFFLWKLSERQTDILEQNAKETRDALRIAQQSADAATTLAEASRRQADAIERGHSVVERAYLFGGIADLELGEDHYASLVLTIMNAGRTPGRVRRIRAGVIAYDLEKGATLPEIADYSRFDDYVTDTILPATSKCEGVIQFKELPPWGLLCGLIDYDDFFRQPHQSRFCIKYNSITNIAETFGSEAWNEYD